MRTIHTALFLLALTGLPALRAASISYQFTISTQTLSGMAGNLDFQLNPGEVPGSPTVSLLISGFTIAGGLYDPAAIQLTGNATGLLPASLSLSNAAGYNDAFQPVTLGSSIGFLATLSGPGVDIPSSPGTFFGFSIYDGAGLNPLLTTSADGTIAGLNVDGTSGIAPFVNPAGGNGASAAIVTPIPEPSTMTMILLPGLGLIALGRASGRRVHRTP